MACVVPIAVWEQRRGELPGERAAAWWLARRVRTLRAWRATQVLGEMATTPIALATVAGACAGTGVLLGVRSAAVVAGAAGVVPLNAALKRWMGATPFFRELTGSRTDNFPSGHAVYAASVFGAVTWLAAANGLYVIAAGAGGVVVAMGPARVMGQVHVPSDVVAGACLGGGWLLLVVAAAAG